MVPFESFSVHTHHNIADAEMFFFYSVWVVAPLSLSGHWTEVFSPFSLQLSFLGVVWEVNVDLSRFSLTSPGEY